MKGNFQIIVVVIFVALAIFGVLVFSGAIPIGSTTEDGGLGTVILWGTVKSGSMSTIIDEFNNANPTFIVKYIEKSPDTFDQDLLETLAAGTGPDLFFLPSDLAFHYMNKISTVPYSSYPVASFKNNFASAANVFLTSNGVIAFPLSIDPLVMYYNKSLLDASGVVYPPATWDDLSALASTLTKKDDTNKIIQSTVAMGHYSNVTHAKDIIATLFMQLGNPIVSENSGFFNSTLDTNSSKYDLSSVLKFYTDFANPNKDVYSWNKSFPNSSDSFSSLNLAFYFGYASELNSLINKNPNQDFGVAPLPQVKSSTFKLTGADVTGVAVLSSSKNFNTALTAASQMATGNFAAKFAVATGTAPARRELLKAKADDSYTPVFYSSALYAKAWFDPSPKDTNQVFKGMIEGVVSNNTSTADAIRDASSKLGFLLIR